MLTGLLFPKLEYGRQLMALGIDRLRRYQVGKALSADGVWLENSFGYHCWIVSLFTRMLADMRTAGAPDLPLIREALQRMLPFVEALIKVDGQAPLIGGTGPGQFLPTIVAARRELALTTLGDPSPGADNTPFVRAQTTYCFPESGYFASHSKPELSKDSVQRYLPGHTEQHEAQTFRRSLGVVEPWRGRFADRWWNLQQADLRFSAQRCAV